MKKEKNGFEKREELGDAYWKDPLWKEVRRLRDEDKHAEANSLVFEIRSEWGLM